MYLRLLGLGSLVAVSFGSGVLWAQKPAKPSTGIAHLFIRGRAHFEGRLG